MKKSTNGKQKALGIGIIGCGGMGVIHSESYARAKGCKLVGFTNRTRNKAEALAKRFGGKTYAEVAEMLADETIDAVSICSSQQVHAEQIIAAARAGKHILAEKPLALTSDEMDAIDSEVKRAGVTLMVGHQLRFHPVIDAVAAAMPKLGRCYHLDLEMCFRIAGHEGRCWMDYRSGGFFMELGVHLADLSRRLMGPIDHVSAHTLRTNPKRVTEDYTHALLQFQSKAVGSIVVSANHRTRRQGLLIGRVIGEKGRIDFHIYPYKRTPNDATMTLDKGKAIFIPDVTVKKLTWKNRPSLSKVYPGFFDVYQREIEAFLNSVRTGKNPPITLDDGRSAVEVVLAVYDGQGRATTEPNFRKRSKAHRSDESCHPLLAK